MVNKTFAHSLYTEFLLTWLFTYDVAEIVQYIKQTKTRFHFL